MVILILLGNVLGMDRKWLNEVADMINEKISDSGYECVEVEWLEVPETLRVYIDNGQEMSVDDCAIVNKILFEFNELDQKINKAYNLEVSSLGLEPPLRLPTHFKKYLGKTIKLKLQEKVDGRNKFKGEILSVDDSGIVLQVSDQEKMEIPFQSILKAKLAYSF